MSCENAEIEPKLMYVGIREDMRQLFIAAEDDYLVDLPNIDLGERAILLLNCYNVFDVCYPIGYFSI